MSWQEKRDEAEPGPARYRRGSQSFASMMVDLHTAFAVLGGSLAALLAGDALLRGPGLGLGPTEAVLAAGICAAATALMLLARRFVGFHKWAGLAWGLPIFGGLALLFGGVAAAYSLRPAWAEFQHLKASDGDPLLDQQFEAWLGFLERHAETPEAAEAAARVTRNLQDSELPGRTRPLLALYRQAPARHRPILEALRRAAGNSKALAQLLQEEGLAVQAEQPGH